MMSVIHHNVPFRVHQGLLVDQLKSIFPDVQTHTNKIIRNPYTGAPVELDVCIPDHGLCFEFQDSHHYTPTWYYQNTQSHITHSDYTKKALARNKELTLVVVPLWWDGSAARLSDLIHFQRPDLLATCHADLIPLNPARGFFQTPNIPGIGELMHASYTRTNDIPNIDHSSWWMGEKYDGVRFCWNSSQRRLYTRFGTVLRLNYVTHAMPKVFADGELWFGRGNYTIACQLTAEPTNFSYWHLLRMILFDVPAYSFQIQPFEIRYQHLVRNVPVEDPIHVVASRVVCTNKTHFKR